MSRLWIHRACFWNINRRERQVERPPRMRAHRLSVHMDVRSLVETDNLLSASDV